MFISPRHRVDRRIVGLGSALALLVVGAVSLQAQSALPAPPAGQPPADRPPGPRMGRGRVPLAQMLLEGITLSNAQRARIDSIMSASAARREAQVGSAAGGPPDSAAFVARRQRMREETQAIRAVLTVDQQPTFDANAAELERRMRERMGGARAPGQSPRERR